MNVGSHFISLSEQISQKHLEIDHYKASIQQIQAEHENEINTITGTLQLHKTQYYDDVEGTV